MSYFALGTLDYQAIQAVLDQEEQRRAAVPASNAASLGLLALILVPIGLLVIATPLLLIYGVARTVEVMED